MFCGMQTRCRRQRVHEFLIAIYYKIDKQINYAVLLTRDMYKMILHIAVGILYLV